MIVSDKMGHETLKRIFMVPFFIAFITLFVYLMKYGKRTNNGHHDHHGHHGLHVHLGHQGPQI